MPPRKPWCGDRPAHGHGPVVRDRARQAADPGGAGDQGLEAELRLHARERGAEAEVDPVAEVEGRGVAPRIEGVGGGEALLVAARRADQREDQRTRGDGDARQRDVVERFCR